MPHLHKRFETAATKILSTFSYFLAEGLRDSKIDRALERKLINLVVEKCLQVYLFTSE